MPVQLSADQVWREVEKNLFAVVGYSNAAGEPRTAGIVYVVRDRVFWVATAADSWKARLIRANPAVSLTVTIPKSVPLMPWIRVPPATITLQGTASVLAPAEASADIQQALLRGIEADESVVSKMCFIRIEPRGRFVTYGVGVSLLQMRKPEAARGLAPID